MEYLLPDLNLLKVVKEKVDDPNAGKFVIEPLSPGYGVTIGNSLRRVLLASLEGYAAKSVKIHGVSHEYATIKGVKEDVVDIILNLKMVRFKLTSDEPVTLNLSVKGPKKVTAADFKKSSGFEAIDPSQYIATIEKGGTLDLEVVVDKGRGYVPVEKRQDEKVPIGTILVDSIYTPVKKVKYEVENARVGSITNYNRLVIEIATDGSVSPEGALKKASAILMEHMSVLVEACDSFGPKKTTETKKSKIKKKDGK